MKYLPSIQSRIEQLPDKAPLENLFPVGLSRSFHSKGVQFVTTSGQAENILQLAMEKAISHIGFDTEYRYGTEPVRIKRSDRYDISTIKPLLMSIAMVEPGSKTDTVFVSVIDLRQKEVLPALRKLFLLPVPFIAHNASGDLFCLWQLEIPEPQILWDSSICEKALHMGKYHIQYETVELATVSDEITAQQNRKTKERIKYSLVDTCRRYEIPYQMESAKDDLQSSFLTHKYSEPFSQDQIKYSAEDAIAVAKLYPIQIAATTKTGILHHLVTVEMPWTITSASMEWVGFYTDQALINKVKKACSDILPALESKLKTFGLNNAQSNPQVYEFFKKLGLLHLFGDRNDKKFDKILLKRHKCKHPAIELISKIRKIKSIQSNGILDQVLIGNDGKVHPTHKQLGTHTSRQTSKNPNILGLPGVLRPVVIPSDGYGIGEVDLCQIEIGVTAAYYDDPMLTKMYNSGDVYSAMAQHFYVKDLSDEDLNLSGKDFKRLNPDKRSIMKTCTLAIIYGSSSKGLAGQLDVSISKANTLLQQFFAMFPSLEIAKSRASFCSYRRGYASTISGIRRNRGNSKASLGWENRWMINFPVQGSAAAAFKAAGNRLYRLYPALGGRLVIPVHDSFVFEAPLENLQEVAEMTGRVLCECVQEYFPQLRPRADINIQHPECWNKDGNASSVVDWLSLNGQCV